MTDEELLDYALIHSETDLALFHKDHIKRIFELAQESVPTMLDSKQFWSVYSDIIYPLVEKAKNRLKIEACPQIQNIVSLLKELTDEKRLEVFSKFCRDCGRVYLFRNDHCYCNSDD